MRMAIFAILALLVLGGGGAGAYFYFQKPAEASVGPDAGDDHDIAKKDKHAKKGGHGADVAFIEMDPLLLPIVDNSGVTQVISLVIALEVADKEAAKEIELLTPRLKDAYIQDMYGVLNRYAALKGGVVQVSVIKERLNKITTEVLGEDKVNDVLLQVVQQRPI